MEWWKTIEIKIENETSMRAMMNDDDNINIYI